MSVLAEHDFRTRRKDVIRVTIGDDRDETVLSILPPTKRIHEDLVRVAGVVDSAQAGELDYERLDLRDCLEIVARAMSHNTECRRITADYLESIEFDLLDIGDFIGLYLFFIMELAKGKS